MMKLEKFNNAESFYKHAESFLLRQEEINNLIISLCLEQIQNSHLEQKIVYMATVCQGSEIIAAAFRTPSHNLLVTPASDLTAFTMLADDLLRNHDPLPGVTGPNRESEAFSQEYTNRTGQQAKVTMAQRIYRLDNVSPLEYANGHLRKAATTDRDLLMCWLAGFDNDALHTVDEVGPRVDKILTSKNRGQYIWEDNKPVSMAGFSGLTPNGVRISAVYTPPEYRRKGYASACVAKLSQLMLDNGKLFCTLYTDLSNPISNHIYQEIGYRPICDSLMYQFQS